MRVSRVTQGPTDADVQRRIPWDGGYKLAAAVAGRTADGGVLELEACKLTSAEYAALRAVAEGSGKRCLLERSQ